MIAWLQMLKSVDNKIKLDYSSTLVLIIAIVSILNILCNSIFDACSEKEVRWQKMVNYGSQSQDNFSS